jgi:hypothetical protein
MTEEPKKKAVDETWKKQVEHEKEKLVDSGEEQAPPAASMSTLVSSLGMQAMFHLGMIEDPVTRQAHVDPLQAQYAIDMLAVLEEKTKGNLTAEESELLKGTLGELRMIYLRVMQAVEKHLAEQAKSGPPGKPGPAAPPEPPGKIIY